jgi:hypothetical protein
MPDPEPDYGCVLLVALVVVAIVAAVLPARGLT